MYYYVEIKDNGFSLEKATKKEVIARFAEVAPSPAGIVNRFFYDKSDKCIYQWQFGKKTTNGIKYEEDEALDVLFKFALFDCDADERLFFKPTQKEDLLEQISEYMENNLDLDDENDVKVYRELQGIINQLIDF